MVSVLSEFVLSVLLYFYFFPGEGNHANCLLLHFFFTYFSLAKGPFTFILSIKVVFIGVLKL